jgi:hypothetical protein
MLGLPPLAGTAGQHKLALELRQRQVNSQKQQNPWILYHIGAPAFEDILPRAWPWAHMHSGDEVVLGKGV